jgi:hypothetical protein
MGGGEFDKVLEIVWVEECGARNRFRRICDSSMGSGRLNATMRHYIRHKYMIIIALFCL